MYYKLVLRLFMVALSFMAVACSKDKIHLEGDRIAVLQGKTALKPDFQKGEVKILLPRPETNITWSQKGGNSEHAMQHLMASKTLKEEWSSSFGDGDSKRDFLIAEPIIAHKTVFAIDAEGVVSAFRQDSGDRIWKKRLKPQNRDDKSVAMKGAGLAANGTTLYATTGFGGVFALDMITGKKIWKKYIDLPIRIAPTVGEDKIFVQAIDNSIFALDAKSGSELWKYKASTEATTLVGGASSAYNAELDVLIAAFSNGELRAFKASTGSPLWSDFLVAKRRSNSMANINAIKANPVIDGPYVFAGGNNSVLVAFDIRTGARVWEREIGITNQPWVAGDYMFVLSNENDLMAIQKASGKIIWSINIPTATKLEDKVGVFISGPVLANNRLIVATSSGFAFAVSPYVGELLGFVTLDDGVSLPPVVGNGMVVFTTNDAELLAYQ